MNWKKRKKLRKIAHSHGLKHYYQWKYYKNMWIRYTGILSLVEQGASMERICVAVNNLYLYCDRPDLCMSYEDFLYDSAMYNIKLPKLYKRNVGGDMNENNRIR